MKVINLNSINIILQPKSYMEYIVISQSGKTIFLLFLLIYYILLLLAHTGTFTSGRTYAYMNTQHTIIQRNTYKCSSPTNETKLKSTSYVLLFCVLCLFHLYLCPIALTNKVLRTCWWAIWSIMFTILDFSLVQGSVRTAWPLLYPTAPSPVHQCMREDMELVTPNSIGNKVCLCEEKHDKVPAVVYVHGTKCCWLVMLMIH